MARPTRGEQRAASRAALLGPPIESLLARSTRATAIREIARPRMTATEAARTAVTAAEAAGK